MATYTFQQNYPSGASNGYVKCELKPGPGELADRSYSMNLTVFDKNTARTRVHVYLKPPAGVTGDPYHVEQKTVTIPKNTATAAKITLQQRNGYLGDLPSEWWTARLIDCPVQFVVEGSAGTTDVWCVGTAAQTVRMRYMILDPRILALDFKRVALSGQDWVESDEGTAIMGDLAFSAVVTRFGLTIAKFDIACSDGTTSTINLTQAQIEAAMASGGISETQPGIFANVLFDASKKYTVTLTIGDDFETVSQQFELSDAFTNLHLSGCGKGVAVGKYSASTVNDPLFECQYPAKFYDDVDMTPSGGNIGNVAYTRVGNVVTVNIAGSVSLSGNTLATLPVGYRPGATVYFFTAISGTSTKVPYLAAIDANGVITIYRRSESVSYLYGQCVFIVDG